MGRRLWGAFLSAWLLPTAALADVCQGEVDAYARLACHERVSWTTGKSAACMRLNGDRERLACFDQTPKEPAPKRRAVATASTTEPRFRIEGGWGYGVGNYEGTIGRITENLTIGSLLSVRGSVVHLGIWDDRLISSKVSIGVEYVKLKTHSEVSGNAFNGAGAIDRPIYASAEADISANLVYLNFVYRPRQVDTLRPFIGGGIGIGRAKLQTTYSEIGITADGETAQQNQSSWVAGVQALGGVEVNIGAGFHLTPAVRLLYFTSRPVGLPHDFFDINLEMGLGYRF